MKLSNFLKNKYFIFLSILLLISIAYIGINLSGFFVLSDTDKETINLGVLIPLTGAQSYLGESELNGYTLALEEYNQNNPKYNLKFHIEDSQANPKVGVDGINKLIFANNIDYAYVTLVPVASPISPIVNEHEVSTFIQVITPHLANDYKHVYKFYPDASNFAKKMSDDLVFKNIENVSLVIYNTDAGIYFIEEFKKNYKGNINTIELFSLDEKRL